MGLELLSEQQLEQFYELGWLKVEEAIPRDFALQAQDLIWDILEGRHNIKRNDRSTWESPFLQISENFGHGIFAKCSTSRIIASINDLLGKHRWNFSHGIERMTFGWWPINFYIGSDKKWNVPTGGWHWDGMHFRHYLDSKEQGLLLLVLFSDINKHSGGTLVAEGSHKLVANFLKQYPDGIEYKDAIPLANRSHPWLRELTNSTEEEIQNKNVFYSSDIDTSGLYMANRVEHFMNNYFIDETGTKLRVVETLGSAGDIILCHPFLYHAASQNHSQQARIMCNLTVPLKERPNLIRNNLWEYSPLEISILRAI